MVNRMMPNFFKQMPPRDPTIRTWEISVWVVSSRNRTCRYVKTMRCTRRRAYLIVRLWALWIDLMTPDCDGELGVEWQMTAVTELRT